MDIFILVIAVILILLGLVLIILNFPGEWLVFVGVLVHAWYHNFADVSVLIVGIMLLLTLIATVTDNIAVGLTSHKFGGSKYGIIGAIIGGFLGVLIANIIGLLIGVFVGAVIAEILIAGKDIVSSAKAGFGAFLGFFVGTVLKFGLSLSIVIIWAILSFLTSSSLLIL
jgi:uncharacterized protein YqgC (DUF456 family)